MVILFKNTNRAFNKQRKRKINSKFSLITISFFYITSASNSDIFDLQSRAILKRKLDLPRNHGTARTASNIPDLPQWSVSNRRSRVPLKTTIPRGTRQTLSHVMAIKSEFYYIHVKKTDWFPGKPCLRQIGADLVQQSISGQVWYLNNIGANLAKIGAVLGFSGQIWLK